MLEAYLKLVRKLLPSPFSIALLLSIATFVAVLFYTLLSNQDTSLLQSMSWWQDALWTPSLMVFAMQMMLMLVLGHALALSPIVDRLIKSLVKYCDTTPKAAAIVCVSTLVVGLFNWGFGLIFGAIFARKVGEYAQQNKIALNYPLIGAAGYTSLMVWHGGFSGSAIIKVAEPGHLAKLIPDLANQLPNAIRLGDTLFSSMNLFSIAMLILILPTTLYFVGKKTSTSFNLDLLSREVKMTQNHLEPIGAEKLDKSTVFNKAIGASILAFVIYQLIAGPNAGLSFFNPNNINLLLFALCLASHKSIEAFIHAIEAAIVGAGGILIQFPLYFGIMGLMKQSGLIEIISQWFSAISNQTTYPIFTFLSAGLVNIFVPSGGGQWAIQGPIIIKSSLELGISFEKSILALAYGDELTNMLQPFWALPLLGITRLSAKDILPYTLIMFAVGFFIFMTTLLLF